MAFENRTLSTLLEIPKQTYHTIIWDLRGQKQKSILGGKDHCPHVELEESNHCTHCGAYKGLIREMESQEYKNKLLTELAVSPATDKTIIITDRAIGDECILRSPTLQTPHYTEYVWVSKWGSFFDTIKQKATYLIYHSKSSEPLSNSKYICNHTGYDPRLLAFGKTLVISPAHRRWVMLSDQVDYYLDNGDPRDAK